MRRFTVLGKNKDWNGNKRFKRHRSSIKGQIDITPTTMSTLERLGLRIDELKAKKLL